MTGTRTLRSYFQSLPEGVDTKMLSPDLKKVDFLDFATQDQGMRADSAVQSIVPGFGIGVDASNPQNPKVSVTGGVGLGSVTSVAMTVPAGLSVAGSPINTSGTFAMTWAAGYQAYSSAEAAKLAGITLGAASGNVPVLDGNGKLLTSTLPALAIGDTFTVATQAAMLALTAQRGDVAIRTDISTTFRLVTDDPTVLANWAQILVPGGGVTSIASLTGVVTAAALKTALAYTVGDITDMSANARSFSQAANYAAMFALVKQAATTAASGVVTFATSAQYRANTTTLALSTDQVWSAVATVALGNITGTVALDFATFFDVSGTMTGNITLGATSNLKTGQTGQIYLTQDATGSRTLSVNSTYWVMDSATVPAISTAASSLSILSYKVLPSGKVFIGLSGKAVA